MIELYGAQQRAIYVLAKFSWVYFTITFPDSDGAQTAPPISARFLELNRHLDQFSTLSELIVEMPQNPDHMQRLETMIRKTVHLSFQLQGQSYTCETRLVDTVMLADMIPAVSFEWPEVTYRADARRARRMPGHIPPSLEPGVWYIKDISTHGMSMCGSRPLDPLFLEGKHSLTLHIPLLRPTPIGGVHMVVYEFMVQGHVVRQDQYLSHPLYGIRFSDIQPSAFLLIRHYIEIRDREEQFFKLHDVYPNILLPPMMADIHSAST